MSFTREDIDSRIDELVARHSMLNLPSDASQFATVVSQQAINSSHGGKRLRALLLLKVAEALALHNNNSAIISSNAFSNIALDCACAVEIFQTAALVHDDIIDNSELRRGKPSAHKAIEAALTHSENSDADSQAWGLGIMLGDILATASISVLHEAVRNLNSKDELISTFLRMQKEVSIGQVMDIGMELVDLNSPDLIEKSALDVYRWKTASYTTIAPLEIGLLLGGFSPQDAHQLSLKVGIPLGIAFQLHDDLIDVCPTETQTGKPLGGDVREGKRTVLLADTLRLINTTENKKENSWLTALYSHENDSERTKEDSVLATISLMKSSGAVEKTRKRIATLWEESQNILVEGLRNVGLSSDTIEDVLAICKLFVPEVVK